MTTSFVGRTVHALARSVPQRAAVVDDAGRQVTYRELDRRSNRLAHALLAHGLVPGDRVGVWMEDVVEIVETYVALAKAGLVAVPVGRRLAAEEGAYVLSDVDARALVVTDGLRDRAEAAVSEQPLTVGVLVDTGSSRAPTSRLAGTVLAHADAVRGDLAPLPVAPLPDGAVPPDPAVLIGYTSGTTGFPKGAVVREQAVRAITSMSVGARRLALHGFGLFTASLSFPATITAELFTHLCAGATACLVRGWETEKVLRLVESHAATYLYLPSPVVDEFTAGVAADPRRVASLRTVMHSGSKVPADRLAGLNDVLGPRLVEIWGMMENAGGPITATVEDDYVRPRAHDLFASVGRPVPACAVRSVDAEGRDLPAGPDHVGELLVDSPAMFDGYWNNSEATAATRRSDHYRTGDLGWIDDAGYVYIVDRRTDLIVSGGLNIYPSELERVISGHPDVADVAVVGRPHPRWGRTPVAVVVPRPGRAPGADEVVAHCLAHLAGYKKPTQVVSTDALPYNTSGKVDRRAVDAWLDGLRVSGG